MHRTARLLAVTALTAMGMIATIPAANAVADPALIAGCLARSVGEVSTAVNPMAPGVPAEVPAVHCLTGP
ncbi:hypothetical protein ABZ897_40000 [Nonomuraea sp. NPDC046802]|uniref:hypothetical protein n=1 Tax=Nonomuraea sp. NPDC046802 TaxID=3154919 RepID=UPI0033D5049C